MLKLYKVENYRKRYKSNISI